MHVQGQLLDLVAAHCLSILILYWLLYRQNKGSYQITEGLATPLGCIRASKVTEWVVQHEWLPCSVTFVSNIQEGQAGFRGNERADSLDSISPITGVLRMGKRRSWERLRADCWEGTHELRKRHDWGYRSEESSLERFVRAAEVDSSGVWLFSEKLGWSAATLFNISWGKSGAYGLVSNVTTSILNHNHN